jgi:WhiB family redox-sensing transcriptional regulator
MKGDPWTMQAACRDMDGEIFFPTSIAEDRFDRAKEICRSCEVKKQCLKLVDHLAEQDDRWGIFGGLTPHERYLLKKREGKK